MLVAAALVPDTVLLVPGASGRTDAAGALRAAAVEAVASAVRAADRVVVVAPDDGAAGSTTDDVVALAGPVSASLAPVGVPDHLLADAVGGDPIAVSSVRTQERRVAPPGASLALHLLAAAGWSGPPGCLVVARTPRAGAAGALRTAGRAAVGEGRTALVVVGSASGRHGPDGPLADDPAAPAYDARLIADLAAADPDALDRLAGLDAGEAAALAVTGWGPWQVLLGALDGARVVADVRGVLLLGAQHVVGTWVAA
ncbi:hypothetical protein [Cellulomonas uda]|uniref:Extradiol ring-cleavage dioxygenase class III enzyme subunit B domain-containing protein n=1 Tax=Cellulomonas uda TaxID=1714 RepID=A0A4Y3K6Q5_CELUD|nr:hypothetical protein [Cellulomonas uda]NII67154.1 hypothetical protein [Cellulomonas uda]GEA80169.1 hypothetical protein CUD01_06130 [Cellulomonas uda]